MNACTPPRNTACRRAGRVAQRGFTLVEAVISAGLIGLLAVSATWFWVSGFAMTRNTHADASALADGRMLLERLAREIRETKSIGTAYCISSSMAAPVTQMVFNRTVGAATLVCGGASPTGTPLSNDYAVSIGLTGTTLSLGYAGNLASPVTTQALTTHANSFRIRYFDQAGVATTSTSAVRMVELRLTVKPPGVQATQLKTLVGLRN